MNSSQFKTESNIPINNTNTMINKHNKFQETLSQQKDEHHLNFNKIIDKHNVELQIDIKYVVSFLENIVKQISELNKEVLPNTIDLEILAQNIVDGLPNKIMKNDFETYVSGYLIVKSSYHYYYDIMAAHIEINRLHSITSDSFLTTVNIIQGRIDIKGIVSPQLSDETMMIINKYIDVIEKAIDYKKDYLFDYFGIRTLQRSYLTVLDYTTYKFVERPQHMWMRVAIGIHGFNNIDDIIETYNLMSSKYFTHATPTLFNAGKNKQQMSSCFLQSMEDTSQSITSSLGEMAEISKWAGGIGVHISSLRAKGSLIRGTNGLASGPNKFVKLINGVAEAFDQGGKRNGSIATYLEPWHPYVYEFCDLRKNTGDEGSRARDLYLGLWVPSLFMERVKNDEIWSLMCPDECPNLNKVHSEEFNKLYTDYEKNGMYVKQVRARHLWEHIIVSQQENGFPYMLFKDHSNNKSNQKNLGTIRSSNLCAEIIEYSDENETAVCNLASICLPMYVDKEKQIFDFDKLMSICRVIVRNLNKVIDRNYYPIEKAYRSNMRHRPMGIGVQGLADTYLLMGYSFDEQKSYELNRKIFETIYYASVYESNILAQKYGSYETFATSPSAKGILQFHMWDKFNVKDLTYDWTELIENVKKYGLRNSLLTALMPTASTSQIMGNSECFEPYMSNIFKRSTLAGEFVVVNKNLMKELISLKLWDNDMRMKLIISNGSVQKIEEIPVNIRLKYKTAFEISQKHLVRQSAERGVFIDQSQSLNLFMAEPNFDILTSALFDAHSLGLKTGIYYYRTLPAVNPINFGIDVKDIERLSIKKQNACKWRKGMTKEECLACGS